MTKHANEDLFANTTMTFGEHIEELRTALIRALIGLGIGFAVGMLMANAVVQFIQRPLKDALDRYYVNQAQENLKAQFNGVPPPEIVDVVARTHVRPVRISIDVSVFLADMRRLFPEVMGNLSFDALRLRSENLPGRPAQFCALWKKAGEAGKPAGPAAMWELLTDEQKATISRLAEQDKPTDDDLAPLLAILNSLVDNRELARSKAIRGAVATAPDLSLVNPGTWVDSRAWSHSAADDAKKATLGKLVAELDKDLDTEGSRRLNRMLMTAVFHEPAFEIRLPLIDVPAWEPVDMRVQSLGAQEAFMIWMKAALVVGVVVASPWMFWQIWRFVAAGLYPHEKAYVRIYGWVSAALFLSGVVLAFMTVFQPVLDFLFTFNRQMNIDPDPRISEWLGFVLLLPLGFGISFQLPIVMLFLNRLGILSLGAYTRNWRISILVIFIIAMVLTPAEPISMLLMACPLTVLYFLGIAMCRWMPRVRNPFAEETAAPA